MHEMGRISKRKAAEHPVHSESGYRRYHAGIYARLSSDQEAKMEAKEKASQITGNKRGTHTSESKTLISESKTFTSGNQTLTCEGLETQIEIAKRYVEEFNQRKHGESIEVVGCYTDLGKTGSNFERSGFQKLMQDIRLGEIDCVIVKDLSRFGRNYLEAGNYIEKIFPFLGVRFIAVSDGYDTGEEESGNRQMISEIKNLVNDMYAKDFSKKAKLQLRQRRGEGCYVGGPPPYGYKAVRDGKKRVLVPDENTAEIVRYIYDKFVKTESFHAVADELNRQKISPPVVYKQTGKVYYLQGACCTEQATEFKGWNGGTVERILKSRTYIGTLEQGKSSITARDEKSREHKPEGEWVIIRDSHEALVSQELYQRTQETLEKIRKRKAACEHPTKGCPLGEDIYDSVLYCGVCGKKMTRDSHVRQDGNGRKMRVDGYFCRNAGQTRVPVCPKTNRIRKSELADILLCLLCAEFMAYLDQPKRFMEYGKEQFAKKKKEMEAGIRVAESRIRGMAEEESRMYMDYRAGKIEQKEFVSFKTQQKQDGSDLKKQEDALREELEKLEKFEVKYFAAIKPLLRLKSGKELTKDMVETFVSKVCVYPGKRVEVEFTFSAGCLERG